MQSLNKLQSLLADFTNGNGRDVQNLYYELIASKPVLKALFDIPPRNEAERNQLQTGNASLAVQSLTLSTALNISENYASEIIDTLLQTDPNLKPERRVEKAVHIFHSRRSSIVSCLGTILDGSIGSENEGADLLGRFAKELFVADGGNFGEKILDEVNKVLGLEKTVSEALLNARSETNLQAQTISAAAQQARLTFLRTERHSLCQILFSAAKSNLLPPSSILKLITFLSQGPQAGWVQGGWDGVEPVLLCVVLVALMPPDEGIKPIIEHPSFVRSVNSLLESGAQWKSSPGAAFRTRALKAAVQLSWALFGRQVLTSNIDITRHRTPFNEEWVEDSLRHAIESDAFVALLTLVWKAGDADASVDAGEGFGKDSLSYAFALRQNVIGEGGMGGDNQQPNQAGQGGENMGGGVQDFFVPHLLNTVLEVVLHLIGYAPSILKSIRTRQEDLLGASARARRGHAHSRGRESIDASHSGIGALKPRSDIATFFVLIGSLYALLPPDSANAFWLTAPPAPAGVNNPQANFSKFLRWAVDVHDFDMARAMMEMVSALCKGRECAEMAYNFLSVASGGGRREGDADATGASAAPAQVSWRALFNLLEGWTTNVVNPRQAQMRQQQQHQHHQQVEITPADVYQLASFLSILRSIATHSARARISLFSHTSFRVLPCLVALIPCHVPLELKGVIFDTIAAFVKPGAGVGGVDVCKEVWNYLEDVGVLGSTSAGSSDKGRLALHGSAGLSFHLGDSGVAFELEDVEIPAKRFPSTLGFLDLLKTLIHPPRSIPLSKRLLEYEPIDTVPENFGAPRRTPGVMPFTQFVIDRVLLPTLGSGTASDAGRILRDYAEPSEKWGVVDAALGYVENCLAAYTLDELVNLSQEDGSNAHNLAPKLLTHPGFGILHEMLADSPLVNAILNHLRQGALLLENYAAHSSPAPLGFQRSMLRVMRIVHRVLEIQDVFLEVVAPLIGEVDTKPWIGVQFSASVLNGLDQRMVWHPDHVVSIALCAVYGQQDELILMAIRTLGVLAGSPSWAAIDQVPSSSRRHVNRLAVALDRNADSERILDAFVRILNQDAVEEITETDLDQSCGAGASIDAKLPLAEALRWEVLDLLLENADGSRPGPNLAHLLLGFSTDAQTLSIQDPHAEGASTSCLHIVLDLLSRGVPISSRPEDDLQQGPALYHTNPVMAEKCFRLLYHLCNQDLTRDPTMRYLRTRENFFVRQLAAIPSKVPTSRHAGTPGVIHYADQTNIGTTCETVTAFLRMRSFLIDGVAQEIHNLSRAGQSSRLTDIVNVLFGSQSPLEAAYVDEAYDSLMSHGQSLARIIELFYSFDFEWEEANIVEPVELIYYGSANLLAAERPDYAGCMLIDRDALIQILQEVKSKYQGDLSSPSARDRLELETGYILASCTVENHRREVRHAKGLGINSWRRLLDVSLAKCFDRVSHSRQQSIMFELLTVLPTMINSDSISSPAAVSLAETVVSLMVKLREDWMAQFRLGGGSKDIPVDKLLTILKNILECVLNSTVPDLVRGNLYASLVNFLNIVDAAPRSSAAEDGLKLNGSSSADHLNGSSHFVHNRQSDVEIGVLSVINHVVDKLVQTVSRDAIDGTEVWRSVAFTLLDSLVRLSRSERQHRVLAALVKQGSLATFIAGVREVDRELEMIYSPDPSNLNALFVFEARMSLLIRVSQTRQGADQLMNHRLFASLASCEFISAKPDIDQRTFVDHATFLPNALQRYHQLLLPCLQLANSVLASIGADTKSIMSQAIDFVMTHRETFILTLKDHNLQASLSLIREQALINSLCTYILPSLERGQLGPSDFGPLHAACLGLAAKSLGAHAKPSVRPVDEAEFAADAFKFEMDGRPLTRFKLMVEESLERLLYGCISYLAGASNATGAELRRVLTLTMAVTTDETNSWSLQPSIGDVVSTLTSEIENLSTLVRQIENLSSKVCNKELITSEDINRMLKTTPSASGPESKKSQQYQLNIVIRRMQEQLEDISSRALRSLQMVEVLLLLLWRHLDYFNAGHHLEEQLHARDSTNLLSTSRLRMSHSQSEKQLTSAKAQTQFGDSLAPLIGALERVTLPAPIFGREASSQESYIRILCRKLREDTALEREDLGRGSLMITDGEKGEELGPY